ncbi:MAG: RrF2 family transcriptional regulator [Spirochaetaceae bacterium]
MFTLSSKAVYGVTAMVELAHHYRSGPLQIRDIAARHDIPQHYLEQILGTLSRSGLVRSYRGPRGGYELTRHPDAITLFEVLTELEGPPAVLPTGLTGTPLRELWEDLQEHIAGYMSRSLGDIARRQTEGLIDADFVI